ncbi:bifunctional phosphoribosylaminoimidazolecarboxamide formyltransferase/IMP cyclohydrolase [Secundilactobacillus kimchicus]|uniref:bifunctional phosphoribosylaminoimidazolecarboxamide formyltransferase/IMP cyclohydrolase n=1 Tax=Secundilactobacillus kimchicus TaxID=528209 RepID=UPI0024A810EF|nr:bifunctional phosphoribosylaminoimidazolecarboxamide formyltransferase/IMP cyclohydrolase [Secundilactobacillus kimchicus]
MAKIAVLSVSDKTGIVDFARDLLTLGYTVVSTGGTMKTLVAAGLEVTAVDQVTGFPEMLDGRVKTLHPRVHAGILAKREVPAHMTQLADHDISPIDLVCVNLYPFKDTIARPDVSEPEAIEQIDIGGPSMLRSAAKNYQSVLAVSMPTDYDQVMTRLQNGTVDLSFRRELAAKVFRQTAAYDALIADYLTDEPFPEKVTKTFEKVADLRYGENSHQTAAYYKDPIAEPFSLAGAHQRHGKKLSFNNLRDADAALRIIAEFSAPTVVALKHMNPCGIGVADTLLDAWQLAYDADPISIFGGIIVVNRQVDLATAKKMHELFLEIIIAPGFDDDAYEVLAQKKNLRLLQLDSLALKSGQDFVSVLGGVLIQDRDTQTERAADFKVVSKTQPTSAQLAALQFGQTVVKHVKSNAIVVTTANQTLGVGAGQMNRIDAVEIAIDKAQDKPGYETAILASDAFFPMDDCVAYAAEHGIKAIVEPGGSIKDQASIDKADEYGIALVFTGVRHFKH